MDIPETQFTQIGDDRIAYQVVGAGPLDVLFVPTQVDALDVRWEWPGSAGFVRRLAAFSRVIMFDRRGSGGSDPLSYEAHLSPWEEWADDARAVLDAVGCERAAVLSTGPEVGPTAMLFAATEPERTQSLILFSTAARFLAAADYAWGLSHEEFAGAVAFWAENWGTEAVADLFVPSMRPIRRSVDGSPRACGPRPRGGKRPTTSG